MVVESDFLWEGWLSSAVGISLTSCVVRQARWDHSWKTASGNRVFFRISPESSVFLPKFTEFLSLHSILPMNEVGFGCISQRSFGSFTFRILSFESCPKKARTRFLGSHFFLLWVGRVLEKPVKCFLSTLLSSHALLWPPLWECSWSDMQEEVHYHHCFSFYLLSQSVLKNVPAHL